MACNISNLARHTCIASIDVTNFYKRHSIVMPDPYTIKHLSSEMDCDHSAWETPWYSDNLQSHEIILDVEKIPNYHQNCIRTSFLCICVIFGSTRVHQNFYPVQLWSLSFMLGGVYLYPGFSNCPPSINLDSFAAFMKARVVDFKRLVLKYTLEHWLGIGI